VFIGALVSSTQPQAERTIEKLQLPCRLKTTDALVIVVVLAHRGVLGGIVARVVERPAHGYVPLILVIVTRNSEVVLVLCQWREVIELS
jgi:hypothetical protein